MQRPGSDTARWVRLFWFWLLARTTVWTVTVSATQPNAPLDLVEWLGWGFQFAWGYPKHPPLPAWVAGFFAWLSPGGVEGVYLAGYLHVAVCLWAAWRLGLEFLPPRFALMAAMCLDGLIYLTWDGSEFSNNLALDVTWALTVLFFVRALRTEKLRWWLALGLVAGLGLLSKYTLAVLLAALAGYLICNRQARRHLKQPGPYLAAVLALAIFAPHAVWMVRNDFITLHYAAGRSAPNWGWFGHLKHPAMFVIDQLMFLVPVLAILAPLLRRRETNPAPEPEQTAVTDRSVLHWAVLGPIVFLLAISLATGRQLNDTWASPLLTFTGVWLLSGFGSFSRARLAWSVRTWGVVAAAMLLVWVGRNFATPYLLHRPKRVHYPGRALAEEVSRRWHAHCAEPFPIVAGEAWRAGNVCCYAGHRPMIYSNGWMGAFAFDTKHIPWTDDADLASRGGVLVWDAAILGDTLPASARARFPAAQAQPPIVLSYLTGAAIPPDRVGIAFIWPGHDKGKP